MNSRLLAALLIGLVIALLSRQGWFGGNTNGGSGLLRRSRNGADEQLVEVEIQELCPPPAAPQAPECPEPPHCNCAANGEASGAAKVSELASETWEALLGKYRKDGSGDALRRAAFDAIYASKQWGDFESRSGPGSTVPYTANVRKLLATAWKTFAAPDRPLRFLDAPCGDCNWLPKTTGFYDIAYTGADIVVNATVNNARRYRHESNMRFMSLDLVMEELPKAQDMVLCRDALQHLPLKDAIAVVKNIERSGAKYLITNWHGLSPGNHDISAPGEWFMVDIFQPPFNFSQPLFYTVDGPDSRNEKGEINYKLIGVFELPVLGKGSGKRMKVPLKRAMKEIIVVDSSKVKLANVEFDEVPDWIPSDVKEGAASSSSESAVETSKEPAMPKQQSSVAIKDAEAEVSTSLPEAPTAEKPTKKATSLEVKPEGDESISTEPAKANKPKMPVKEVDIKVVAKEVPKKRPKTNVDIAPAN